LIKLYSSGSNEPMALYRIWRRPWKDQHLKNLPTR
jgi:hypothetical protein